MESLCAEFSPTPAQGWVGGKGAADGKEPEPNVAAVEGVGQGAQAGAQVDQCRSFIRWFVARSIGCCWSVADCRKLADFGMSPYRRVRGDSRRSSLGQATRA